MVQDDPISLVSNLRSRIKRYNDKRIEYLSRFYNPSHSYFAYRAEETAAGFQGSYHISTTCTCTILLSELGELDVVCPNKETLINTLLECKWKTATLGVDNPYTVSFVLTALRKLGVPSDHPKIKKGLRKLCDKIKEGSGGISLDPKYEETNSAFVTWWAVNALNHYRLTYPNTNQVDIAIAQALKWSQQEVYRQLSFFASDNSDFRNVHQLAWAWSACKCFSYRPAFPKEISELTLSTIFKAQEDSGVWKKYYPLFNWGIAGSAYVYHFELLMALIFAIREDQLCLLDYLENIEKIITWVESRELTHHNTNVKGWSIDSDPSVRFQPISWATAEVLFVLSCLDSFLLEMHKHLVFKRITREHYTAHLSSVSSAQIVDMQIPHTDTTVLEQITNKIIEPIKALGCSLIRKETNNLCLSAFLFGPPGTSKTTLAHLIASELGWPLLEIDPSHFAPRNDAGLEMRVIEVFSYLEHLHDTVILLDEMDELVRDRDSDESDRIGRLWTTLMLPRMNSLRKKAQCVVVGATNYIERIDEAIQRPGRFDLLIPVGPPIPEGKLKALADMEGVNQSLVDGWYAGLQPVPKEIFDKLLYGELKLLRANMREFTLPCFSEALVEIKEKLYLFRKNPRKDQREHGELFYESCSKYTSLGENSSMATAI